MTSSKCPLSHLHRARLWGRVLESKDEQVKCSPCPPRSSKYMTIHLASKHMHVCETKSNTPSNQSNTLYGNTERNLLQIHITYRHNVSIKGIWGNATAGHSFSVYTIATLDLSPGGLETRRHSSPQSAPSFWAFWGLEQGVSHTLGRRPLGKERMSWVPSESLRCCAFFASDESTLLEKVRALEINWGMVPTSEMPGPHVTQAPRSLLPSNSCLEAKPAPLHHPTCRGLQRSLGPGCQLRSFNVPGTQHPVSRGRSALSRGYRDAAG